MSWESDGGGFEEGGWAEGGGGVVKHLNLCRLPGFLFARGIDDEALLEQWTRRMNLDVRDLRVQFRDGNRYLKRLSQVHAATEARFQHSVSSLAGDGYPGK